MKVDTLVTTAVTIIIMKTLTIKKIVSAIAKNAPVMTHHVTIAIAIVIAMIVCAKDHLILVANK